MHHPHHHVLERASATEQLLLVIAILALVPPEMKHVLAAAHHHHHHHHHHIQWIDGVIIRATALTRTLAALACVTLPISLLDISIVSVKMVIRHYQTLSRISAVANR